MIFRPGIEALIRGAQVWQPGGGLRWPATVFVCTLKAGVYATTTFSGRDSSAQPIWYTVNEGLPVHTDGTINSVAFYADPFYPADYQYVHVKQGPRVYGYLTTDTIFRRRNIPEVGWAWESILTTAEAISIAGITPNSYDKTIFFAINRTIDGKLGVIVHQSFSKNRCIVSTDRGNSWARVGSQDSFGSTSYGFSYTPVFIGDRFFIRNAGGAGTANVNFSINGGATWSTATNGTGALTEGDATRLYARDADVGNDLCLVGFGGTPKAVIQDSLNLYGGFYDYGGMWISSVDPNRQRVLRRVASSGLSDLYETRDSWMTATRIDQYTATAMYDTYRPLVVLHDGHQDVTDFMIFGYYTPRLAAPNSIFVIDRLKYPGSPLAKSGSNPDVSPFEDSIPYMAGGPIARYGIQYVPQ